MSGGGEVVYDGVGQLDEITVAPAVRPCPGCGEPCRFDPVQVVDGGRSIGWATTAEIATLQSVVLGSLSLGVGEFDGHRTVAGTLDRHCDPYVAPMGCGRCGTQLFAVVSYGETQPARWLLVVEGLIAAPNEPVDGARQD